MKGPTPRRLKKYVGKCLGLKSYLQSPGDGRTQGRIPAAALLWALLMGVVLRRATFAGMEALVRSPARRALDVSRRFGDDALGYFTERLDAAVTRRAAATVAREAKRHKAFDASRFIGLVLDGTAAARSREKKFVICVVLTGKEERDPRLSPPVGHGERGGHGLDASLGCGTLWPRAIVSTTRRAASCAALVNLGRRFADYVVVDGAFARAPFLHEANDLGLYVVARLKGNLPELFAAAQKRFRASLLTKPSATARIGWKFGTPTTSILGKPCDGKRCG